MELRWKTPVPLQGVIEDERSYLQRLATWLQEQERPKDYDLEAILAFGGLGVAERIFGFEGVITGYTAPSEHALLQGPTAPKKFVVIGLHVSIDAVVGDFVVIKRKVSADSILVVVDSSVLNHEEVVGGHKTGFITLDAANEGIRIHTLVGAVADISFSGSYVDVE